MQQELSCLVAGVIDPIYLEPKVSMVMLNEFCLEHVCLKQTVPFFP